MSEPQQGPQPAAPYVPHQAAPATAPQPVVPQQYSPQASTGQTAPTQYGGAQSAGSPSVGAQQSGAHYGSAQTSGAQHSGAHYSGPQTAGPQYGAAQPAAPQQYGNAQSGVPQQYGNAQSGVPQQYGNSQPGVPQQALPQREMTYEQRLPVPSPPAMQPPGLLSPPVAPRRRRSVVTTLLLILLILAVGGQTYWIYRLSGQLSDAKVEAAKDRQTASDTVDAVSSRVAELEKAAFHPDQIAKNALPSVFRVKADRFSGTAWAVGKPTANGGANLFTNYHVVETVWEKGGDRKVSIEHNEKLYYAKIVGVDKDKDVAHLQTDEKFPGLAVAKGSVTPGQPIVVVGAPLGLESSVTTGVVSAFRKLEGETNPYVQFDAPINPGNSGGPVINAQGEVVGIASAKVKNAEGIGLAIPVDVACQLFPICG